MVSEKSCRSKPADPHEGNGRSLTVSTLAEHLKLDAPWLRRQGVGDGPHGVAVSYGDGGPVATLTRLSTTALSEWPPREPLLAYGAWRPELQNKGILFVALGELSCLCGWRHGLPVVGLPRADATGAIDALPLVLVQTVYVVRGNTAADEALPEKVTARLRAIGWTGTVHAVELSGAANLADLHAHYPETFLQLLEQAVVEAGRPKDEPQRFGFMSSADFARADFRLDWLIRRVLVRDQPAVLGGPRKALKTTLMVEMALSIGTGTPFLNHFAVEQGARVAVASGESGQAVLQETARRVCAAKGIDLAAANVVWGFELPQLADPAQLAALQQALKKEAVEVLFLDPLYLSLLSGVGQGGPQASNLYQMGPLLLGVARACLDVGCTPVLAHHFKQRPNQHDEPQLEDLAFSGVGEFARQWILVARRERYEPGTGRHNLWLSVGGSAGHSGLWALDVDEGVIDEDFCGRKWEASLAPVGELRQQERQTKENARQEVQAQKDRDDDDAVVRALDAIDPHGRGVSYNRARTEARLSDKRMERAAGRLERAGIIQGVQVEAQVGNGAIRKSRGLRRVPERGT
jgi:replicative DNA helicase